MKTKSITLESGTYEVREATVGVLFPILDLMEKSPKEFQMALVKNCVYRDGALLGDAVNDLGLGDYVTLMQTVLDVTGLGAQNEGKS